MTFHIYLAIGAFIGAAAVLSTTAIYERVKAGRRMTEEELDAIISQNLEYELRTTDPENG